MEKYPKVETRSYGFFKANSYVCRAKNYDDVLECIDYAKQNGLKICPAGSLLSFSNVCILSENISIDTTALNKIIALDLDKEEITVQSGVKTTSILKMIMPLRYTLNSITGSLGNTVAGDISNDVNGKDSWKYGNFGSNVISIRLATSERNIISIDRNTNSEVFNCVVGGMGLLGVILEVTLKLSRIPGYMLHTKSIKSTNISKLCEVMNSLNESETDFAYCWTDPFAPQRSLGRGICEQAKFVNNALNFPVEDLLKGFVQKEKIGSLSPETFWSIFRKIDTSLGFQISGYLKYFLTNNTEHNIAFTEYQYPMVKYFPKWNLKYFPHGFREWQILFPEFNFTDAYKLVLQFCRKEGFIPAICAVRKHIEQAPYLSFSGKGLSMTINYGIDVQSNKKRMVFEEQLLRLIIDLKGKIYIGKFPFLKKQTLEKMYPQLIRFVSLKKEYDKQNLFWSDAANKIIED